MLFCSFSAALKPLSVHSMEISEGGGGSAPTTPTSDVTGVSTKIEMKSGIIPKINNGNQKCPETAIVKPTVTISHKSKESVEKPDISKCDSGDDGNVNRNQLSEESNAAKDKKVSLATTEKATRQPRIEVPHIVVFITT
jgi:hypothetical protein